MIETKKEDYQDYIIRNIFRKFEGRPYKESEEFLLYALELLKIMSFTTAQGREQNQNFTFNQ